MPQIISARFESIGHRDARLDGLVLDFTDNGSPCDSVLWLRNGGGKSSILNLLFSVMRPSQHEFLGTGAEGKLRELRDYLGADEVGQICLEWRLDAPAGEPAPRLITGVCIDQRPSDGQPFKRLWYAVRVPASSSLCIRDLPIVEIASSGKKRVLRPGPLRDRLTALEDGETTVSLTDLQRDWEKNLISFGIDPAVFKYQLEMNKREGAADDLFRFGSSEEFAEFILDMVLDPSAADEVGRRLAELRHKLARKPDLESEKAALERTAPLLRELVRHGEARSAAQRKASESLKENRRLAAALAAGAAQKFAAETTAKQIATSEQERHNAAANRRHNGNWALEVYAWRKASLEQVVAQKESQNAVDELRRVEREKQALDLAPLLEQLDVLEVQRAERMRALANALETNRPLLNQLSSAASSLVAAIDLELATLSARLELVHGRLAAATDALKVARAAKTKETEAIGGLKAKHETKSAELDGLERQRDDLVASTALQEGEPARKALERHQTTAEAEARRASERSGEAAQADSRALEKEQSRSDVVALASRAGEKRAAAEAAIASADLSLRALAEDMVLQRALDDTTPDLMQLLPQAIARLTSTRTRLHEQIVVSGIEAQLDRRALDSLTAGQALLPPSVDAERVQTALRSAGMSAFAGISYLADNVTADRAEARIRAHPDLAAGVVLDASDLEAAALMLSRQPCVVDSPVMVGTTAEIINAGAEKLVVLPPRASFDRAAALQERERRREVASMRDSRAEALRSEESAIDAVRARLQAWGERHPAGWFEIQRRSMEQLDRQEQEANRRASNLAQEIQDERAAGVAARGESQAAINRERKARQAAGRIEGFVSRGGAELDSLAKAVFSIGNEISATAASISKHEAECSRLDAEIETTRDRRGIAQAEQRSLQDERLSAAEHATGVPVATSLPAARESFRVRLEQVRREVGVDAQQARIEQLSQNLEGDRQRFEADLAQAELALADVRQALSMASSTIGVVEARRRAGQAFAKANQCLIDAKAHVKLTERLAADTLAVVNRRRTQRRVVDELVASSESWPLQRFTDEICRLQAEVDAAATEEAEAKVSWDEAQHRANTFEAERKGFESFLPRLDDAKSGLPDGLAVPEITEATPVDRLEGVAEQVAGCVDELHRALKMLQAAEQKAQRSVAELNSFVREDAQTKLPAQLKDRLAEADVNLLIGRAGDFAMDVEQRASTIRQELSNIDEHRKLVAQSLQTVTDPALRVLRRLERASEFPPSVPIWGASPFIRVRLKVPDAVAEQNAVASTLIDQLVALGEIPSGLKLVKRLVRELAGPGGLRIEILKPEPIRRLLYEPVEHLGKFSRGEQLTAAILLYCTLAQQRAISRGGSRAPTSVLILDNPLGTCSNPQLVDLQRAMARAHGVQLIYTTGIEDLEALARLPNILRLRNASVDVRGRRHVSHDENRPSIQAARVAIEDLN